MAVPNAMNRRHRKIDLVKMDRDLEYVYNCESFRANFDEIENPSWSHDWDHMIQRLVLEWYRVWSLSRSRWVSKYLYPAKMPQIRIINGSYLDTIHIADGYFYLENSSILLIQTENISVSHYRSLLYMNHIHCITV